MVKPSVAQDTISLMSYNLLSYYSNASDSATRNPNYRAIITQFNPDILVTQEVKTQSGAGGFLNNVLKPVNSDYQIGPYFQGYDTNNALFYKSSKFYCIDNLIIKTTLRDINHFILIHKQSGDTLHIFSVHLKASSGAANLAQRKSEVDSLRKVSDLFPLNTSYLVCGDFNFYSSNETAYFRLREDNGSGIGHFVDPIVMPGVWNSANYAPYHTQSPRVRAFGGGTTGGLDDRFDLILFSPSINNNGPVRYVANSTIAIGNDGLHFNDSINRSPNLAVSDEIANALHNASDHLPVLARFVFVNGWPASSITSSPKRLRLYPQPSHTTLFVEGIQTTMSSFYSISDLSGRILNQGALNGQGIDITALSDGMYLITCTDERETLTRSFIVAH